MSEPLVLDHDDVWPRDEEHRYRLYAVRGKELEVLAAGDAGGIGQAIITLNEDEKERGRRLVDLGKIGIYDAIESEWVLLPWQRRPTSTRGDA